MEDRGRGRVAFSCFRSLGKQLGINSIMKKKVHSKASDTFCADPLSMSKCSASSKKTEKLCHITKGHLNPIAPLSPSKEIALCKQLICIRGAALISEKAVCNSVSSTHNVAFHVIPYGVVDIDHHAFLSHWRTERQH